VHRRVTVVLLVSCMALAAGVSRAAEPERIAQADEAQFHFLRGNRAYQERRYEDALASYYLSNRLVPNRNVEFNIARCLDRLGRYDEAYRAWSSLFDEGLPDKDHRAVKDAIDQLRPHLALLDIETTPPGATIYAVRRDLGALGVTPKSLALRPGLTKIILERDGYRPVELVAEPKQGTEIKLKAELERIFAEVDVRRIPAEAEVRRDFVDGELLRRGPGTVKVLPGPIVLFISAPGFQTARLMVGAIADASLPVDVVLTPAEEPTGAIVVRANATGALVRVDGEEAGFVPAVIDGVPAGLRRVEIVAEGRQTYSADVQVEKDGRTFVDAYLRRADPEVSAATKSQVASEAAPASISVVTADEIAAFGYTSLTEALVGIRGTFTSNDRSYESVGFRGFSPPGDYTNRVLVLVDGHPLNDAVTGQGYVGHDLDVDLSNVDHIEIVRGPGSVLYGTGALFGVINVVTRRPNEGPHAAVSTMGGTLGLLSGRATVSARKGDAELMLSAAAMTSDGDRRFAWPAEFDAPPTGSPYVGDAVFDADGEKAAHADLLARVGPLSLRAGYNDRKKDIPTGAYDTLPAPGTYNHDRRAFAELRFSQDVHGVGIAARAAYDNSWYHGQYNTGNPAQDLRAQWTTGELRLELPRILHQQLTLGGEAVRQLNLQTDPVSDGPSVPKDLILSAYVVDTIVVGDRLTINLGLRNDRYTNSFGNMLNPRVAVIARPYARGNTKIFFGRSFRVPSPNERADTPDRAVQPETIWSGELEHTHAVNDDVHIVGAVFASWLFNLISLVPDQTLEGVPPYYGSVYRNDSNRVRSLGAEGEIRWEPGSGTLLSLSLTRQQVEQLGPDNNTPFANAPELVAKARVLYPLVGRSLRLGTELVLDSGRHFTWQNDGGHSSSDNRVDDALLWNLSLSGEYRPYRLRYFAGLFNLLDVHDPRAGFPTSTDYRLTLIPRYGRSARAGLAWIF
jgi:outer membrane receptor for ferrienterochelin and colicins